jgi:hypothetical protein
MKLKGRAIAIIIMALKAAVGATRDGRETTAAWWISETRVPVTAR